MWALISALQYFTIGIKREEQLPLKLPLFRLIGLNIIVMNKEQMFAERIVKL
jgi:hypothetical protein